ncbi:putative F0F1-ATPase subunit [compost metagenome]
MHSALSFVGPVLVCLVAGIWLDRKFGTSPLFLFIGLFLGFGTGIFSVYRQVMEQSGPGEASGGAGLSSSEGTSGERDARSEREDT